MINYLLDTNSIIYALNQGVKLHDGKFLVSIITEIELLSYGNLTKHEEATLRALLSRFESIALTQDIKEKL